MIACSDQLSAMPDYDSIGCSIIFSDSNLDNFKMPLLALIQQKGQNCMPVTFSSLRISDCIPNMPACF